MFYGGGKGAGKSDSALRAAFHWADIPYYACLVLRRTFRELEKPGAIMDRARQWLRNTDAHWSQKEYTATFPSGARVVFGHMETEADRFNYDGGEYQQIIFDELPRFTSVMFTHALSIVRGPPGGAVPLQVRGTGTPGSAGQEWVRERFVDTPHPDRRYVFATFRDNPGVDQESYAQAMAALPAVTRAQLEFGDWRVTAAGGKFQREWFPIVEASDIPAGARYVRAWDRAARPKVEGKPDPDYTAGVLMAVHDGRFWIVNVSRGQLTPQKGEEMIRQCAINDGRACPIEFAQERGSAGLHIVEHMQRNVLPGWRVEGHTESGDIETRADPLSSAAELGLVRLVRGHWVPDFLDEACSFPHGAHDDQIAAASLAHWYLTGGPQISTNIMTGAQAGLPTRRLTPSLGQTSGLGRSLGKHF